jgi:DNA-binding transcriptional LysR family regulator
VIRRLDIEALRYLTAAAEAGNFGRAAKALGVQASTVSRSVAHIEDELGVTIFERGHFGIRLTAAGRAVMVQVRRVLADLETLRTAGLSNGGGHIGEIRLGVRMPPIGNPLQGLLSAWQAQHRNVELTLYEMNERDILLGIEERRLDVAFTAKHALWPRAAAEPIYRERILLAVPRGHRLASAKKIGWEQLRQETFLVQGWDESQAAREFFASLLGTGVKYKSHAVSKQSIMALVGARYGVTLITKSQAEVRFPNVAYRPIAEDNAWLEVALVWAQQNEEAVVGRFVAFMRDEARSRGLL